MGLFSLLSDRWSGIGSRVVVLQVRVSDMSLGMHNLDTTYQDDGNACPYGQIDENEKCNDCYRPQWQMPKQWCLSMLKLALFPDLLKEGRLVSAAGLDYILQRPNRHYTPGIQVCECNGLVADTSERTS